MMTLVSIVIPAYNAGDCIAKLLDACLVQDYPNLEIIVVDDGSTDNTREIIQRYPVQYIYQPNKGPAAARNVGWRAARGEFVCFTDSDCVPAEDWVSQLMEQHASTSVAGVGGTYHIANDDNLLATCIHEEIVQRHLRMPTYVNYLGSFNLSYRRSILEEIDGFDESFLKASGEDNDLAYRVIKRGHKLAFTRDAGVAHYHPENLWHYLKQQFWHGYWRVKLYRRHPDMTTGDVYGSLLDLIQPPLCVSTLALAPLALIQPALWVIVGFLGLVVFGLQLPNTLRIVRRTTDPRLWTLAPLTLLRGYARGLGMVRGVWDFFIWG